MPVPSSVAGTATLGSALLSRNSRAIITTMGTMTSPKTNSASNTRWLLTASRNSAFKIANQGAQGGRSCEDLSFSLWHSLPEHRPLGLVNRVRKTAYRRSATCATGLTAGESRNWRR